jgi:hypothetical protein
MHDLVPSVQHPRIATRADLAAIEVSPQLPAVVSYTVAQQGIGYLPVSLGDASCMIQRLLKSK